MANVRNDWKAGQHHPDKSRPVSVMLNTIVKAEKQTTNCTFSGIQFMESRWTRQDIVSTSFLPLTLSIVLHPNTSMSSFTVAGTNIACSSLIAVVFAPKQDRYFITHADAGQQLTQPLVWSSYTSWCSSRVQLSRGVKSTAVFSDLFWSIIKGQPSIRCFKSKSGCKTGKTIRIFK